ncbi:MAG: hypothetical protein ACYTF1_24720 [Planctomycetota bacterium]|jgi:hypothetical protein
MKTCCLAIGLTWATILVLGTLAVKADDLSKFTRLDIEPTVLFVERDGALRQILAISVTFEGGT